MQFAQYGTTVVVIHALVVALHGLAHQKIPIPLSLLQSLFVSAVIVLALIGAVGLLWTSFERAGRWLFLVSMTGALLFGIYNHFIGRCGGYRGILQRKDLKPEISAAVFAATPPQILKPIVTSIGAHLILVDEVSTHIPPNAS